MCVADLQLRDMALPSAEGSGESHLSDTQEESRDEALLQQFVSERNELAFSRLVSRYAGLVMGVWRRALGNREDADESISRVADRTPYDVPEQAGSQHWLSLLARMVREFRPVMRECRSATGRTGT